MNDLPRQKLRELVATYGRELCDDPKRCRALLSDECPKDRREISVLIAALEERVAVELLRGQRGIPQDVLVARLTRRLVDLRGLSLEAARWAVESWGLVLGLEVESSVVRSGLLAGSDAMGCPLDLPRTQNRSRIWAALAFASVLVAVGLVIHWERPLIETWRSRTSAGSSSATSPIDSLTPGRGEDGGSVKEALSAYNRGDYATAFRLLQRLADEGEPDAQNKLGFLYDTGKGVPQDYAEAAQWYRKAADQGNARAQFNLGLLYAHGLGVPQDYAEAVRWYRGAADRADPKAQFNLGLMYANGQGVTQDYVQAHKWFNLAASQAWEAHDRAVRSRDRIAAKMTPLQIVEAHRLVREWKPK